MPLSKEAFIKETDPDVTLSTKPFTLACDPDATFIHKFLYVQYTFKFIMFTPSVTNSKLKLML